MSACKNAHLVEDFAGSASWYVYDGAIPAKWIVGVHKLEKDVRV